MVLAGAFLLGQQRALDRLQLGEAEARHVGVDVLRVKRLIVMMSAVAAGAGVAVAGAIGFVGLVVPHLARLMGGAAHGFVLPASVLLGGALMVCADLVARMVVAGVLAVLHDLNLAARFADDMTLLSNGRVVSSGAPGRVLDAETLGTVYGTAITVEQHATLDRLIVYS